MGEEETDVFRESKSGGKKAGEEGESPECSGSEDGGSVTAPASEEKVHDGPVPRVSMDYCYLSK